LERLIRKGADPNLWTHDGRFGNYIQLAAYYGKVELLEFLRKEGIHDTPGGQFATALQAASARGHVATVEFLLGNNTYRERGEYGTTLCAACANGNIEVVKALLKAGAKLNVDGEQMSISEQ
ncbi:ankyrin repeat-containing domain protein, partial [Mycena galericulata]